MNTNKLKFTGITFAVVAAVAGTAALAGADFPGIPDSERRSLASQEAGRYSALDPNSPVIGVSPGIPEKRIAAIAASVPADTRDLVSTRVVRKSPVGGADVLLSAGRNGSACLHIAGNSREAGAEACFDLVRSRGGDGAWLVTMNDGAWRIQGLVPDGAQNVVATTADGVEHPISVVANVAIGAIPAHPEKVEWADADGRNHSETFGNPDI